MYQLQPYGDFDAFTFEILARRWRAPSDLGDCAVRIQAQGAAYCDFVATHGLTGMMLTHHVGDLQAVIGGPGIERLRCNYLQMAAVNREKIACIRQVAAALQGSAIDWVLLKGLGLSLYAYGNVDLRQTQDVDILISEDQLDEVLSCLRDAGFRPLGKLPPSRSVRGWMMRTSVHQCDLVSPADVLLEVHWRSDFSPQLSLPGLSHLESHIESLPIGGTLAPCLTGSILAVQVARHGYRSMWLRWKWLYDIVETSQKVMRADPAVGERLVRDPTIDASLFLAESLMKLPRGTLLPVPGTKQVKKGGLERMLLNRDAEVRRFNVKKSLGQRAPFMVRIQVFARHIWFQSQAFERPELRLRYIGWRLSRWILFAG